MSLAQLSATDALAQLAEFDAIIDARSPSEFALDHLPGAVNWPVLDDDERRIVGTLDKQVAPLQARKVGAAMAARRIAQHIDAHVGDLPREWRPLVYCWRGGQRSGSLAWFLGQIGFRTTQLGGGYKAFRAVVREQLQTLPTALNFQVLCGRTGNGKTRLLHALAHAGAQVLDLEGLACHRGSVLGALPGQPQPSQKHFDTLLWSALRSMDAARPVFVESESARIGALRVPDALLQRFREHGQCWRVELPATERVQLLLQEYAFFAAEPERFCQLLEHLVPFRGHAVVAQWQAMARAGLWGEVFDGLMRLHYDPMYEASMARSFPKLAAAPQVVLRDGSAGAMTEAALRLIGGLPQ